MSRIQSPRLNESRIVSAEFFYIYFFNHTALLQVFACKCGFLLQALVRSRLLCKEERDRTQIHSHSRI